MPAAQYVLDVSTAASDSPAALQNILNSLNPMIGTMSAAALAEFQSQLESITGSGTGIVTLAGVDVDPASLPAAPLFDLKLLGSADETLQAGAGHDTIIGAADDIVYGSTNVTGGALIQGASNDVITGGVGDDTINAGSGFETIVGGSGAQSITGSSTTTGHALIFGGAGPETLKAGSGSDTIYGGSGDDTIFGGSGKSTIFGGSGDDVIKAGTGASTIYAGTGHDTVYGGNLGDTTFVVGAATFNTDSFTGGVGLGKSILDLSDLNPSDVSITTKSGVTTVTFGQSTITLKNVNEIDFSNGTHQTLK